MNSTAPAGWWAPIRRGLFSDPSGKHFRKMGTAIWLYCHLHQVADWQTGRLLRTYRTLENETGIPERTLQRMMQTLRQHGYIQVTQLARALSIEITKWKPISNKVRVANNGGGKSGEGRHICRQGSPHLTSTATSGELLNGSNNNRKPSSTATSGEPIKSPLSKPNKKETLSPKKSSDSKPKARKKTNPDITVAVDHFHDEFLRIHGFKPQINGAHAKTFQGLLRDGGRSLSEVKELTTAYLKLPDERLREKGYPVEWLPGNINGLLLKNKPIERGFVH